MAREAFTRAGAMPFRFLTFTTISENVSVLYELPIHRLFLQEGRAEDGSLILAKQLLCHLPKPPPHWDSNEAD